MEEENKGGWIGTVSGIVIGALIVYFIFEGSGKYEGRTSEEWFNAYDEETGRTEELQNALEEANSNIEEANYTINSAKSYAWEPYDDMGYALESLEEIESVSEPY